MRRSDGLVKVLDFGLAKAFESRLAEPDGPLTMTETGTRAGVILGTTLYMSPEQTRGLPVDTRTDIWSFGCVLYEMLTGQPAFDGRTTSDIIARVLEHEPDWSRLPKDTPVGVRRILQRCLDKDSKRRLRDIGEARVELDLVMTPVAREVGDQSGIRQAHVPRAATRRYLLVGAIGAGIALWSRAGGPPTSSPPSRSPSAVSRA